MTKKHPRSHVGGSRRRGQVYGWDAVPESRPKLKPDMRPDKRMNDPDSTANSEPVICECGATVKPVLARFGDSEVGVRQGITMVYPNHRLGGGRYSIRRGDVLCTHSQRPVT